MHRLDIHNAPTGRDAPHPYAAFEGIFLIVACFAARRECTARVDRCGSLDQARSQLARPSPAVVSRPTLASARGGAANLGEVRHGRAARPSVPESGQSDQPTPALPTWVAPASRARRTRHFNHDESARKAHACGKTGKLVLGAAMFAVSLLIVTGADRDLKAGWWMPYRLG
jgi:hypothetical protein